MDVLLASTFTAIFTLIVRNLPSEAERRGIELLRLDPSLEKEYPGRVGWKVLGCHNIGREESSNDSLPEKPEGATRVVLMSDTHNLAHLYSVPEGDFFLHGMSVFSFFALTWRAGDFTDTSTGDEIRGFCQFLKSLKHEYKIVVAGMKEEEENTSMKSGKEQGAGSRVEDVLLAPFLVVGFYLN
jgi:hypothetical protein